MSITIVFMKVPKRHPPKYLPIVELSEFGVFIQWSTGPNCYKNNNKKDESHKHSVEQKKRNKNAYFKTPFM